MQVLQSAELSNFSKLAKDFNLIRHEKIVVSFSQLFWGWGVKRAVSHSCDVLSASVWGGWGMGFLTCLSLSCSAEKTKISTIFTWKANARQANKGETNF